MTESSLVADPARSQAVLGRLHELGLGVAIDDFGTGYSSLAQLRRMPVDELKIDRSFVTGMTSDENDAVIVRSTIELGRHLGLRVVAEGVESRRVWEQLAMLGCHVAQGFHFGRPMPSGEFLERLIEGQSEGRLAHPEVADPARERRLRVLRAAGG